MRQTGASTPKTSALARLARWCVRRRRQVLAGWLIALLAGVTATAALGSRFDVDTNLPGTDSQAAYSLLNANFPDVAGEGDRLVIATSAPITVTSAPVRRAVTALLTSMGKVPGISSIGSPYSAGNAGQVNPGGSVAFATINWTSQTPSSRDVKTLVGLATASHRPGVHLSLSGSAITDGESSGTGLSIGVGVIAALAILLIVFGGALFASALPLLAAGLALVVSLSVTTVLTHVLSVPSLAVDLSVLIGLGVGGDYGLFVISRHRSGVKAGLSYEDAAVRAVDTSGRTVLFAGITVCIALLGQFALGVAFLNGLATATAIAVALTMATSLTFLPAMLGVLGPRVLSRRERRAMLRSGPFVEQATGFWLRWARFVERRKVVVAVSAMVALGIIAIPLLSMRLGSSDSGTDPAGSTTRQAYDTLATGFGPGVNGPLELVAHTTTAADTQAFHALTASVGPLPDVASLSGPVVSPNGHVSVITLYPRTGPQDSRTEALVRLLRTQQIPAAERGNALMVHVGGQTASNLDFSHSLAQKLPVFIAVVVILAFVLLTIVFGSLLIPLVASLMNLLSIAAALGAVNAAFSWGYGQSLLHLSGTGPVDAFLPVLLFSILFGLSMDYEVYLVERMQEHWRHGPAAVAGTDTTAVIRNRDAVLAGHARSGPIIAAAALIMILVFGSFMLGGERPLQEFGFGLAFSVLLDALVIRSLLVPALMHLIGPANWGMPAPLARWLPRPSTPSPARVPA